MKRDRILVTLALAHLTVVALGAMQLKFAGRGKLFSLWELYRGVSAAFTGYSFYAPGVGAQIRARFDVTFPDGSHVLDTLQGHGDNEVVVRSLDVVNTFARAGNDEKVKRAFAASWAGTLLTRYPGACGVEVHVFTYDVPSMKDAVAGKLPSSRMLYDARFLRPDAAAPCAQQVAVQSR